MIDDFHYFRLSRRARSALAMVSASSIISLMMMMVAGWAITNDYVKLEDTNYTCVSFHVMLNILNLTAYSNKVEALSSTILEFLNFFKPFFGCFLNFNFFLLLRGHGLDRIYRDIFLFKHSIFLFLILRSLVVYIEAYDQNYQIVHYDKTGSVK